LYKMASNDSQWYCDMKTVSDTRRDAPGESGEPVMTEAMIEQERRSGMSEDMIQQEYYCDFHGSLEGSYYIKDIVQAEKAGRLKDVPWDPTIPVYTFWDLGYDDSTSIWFVQSHGYELGFIDYEEESGKGLPYYAKIIQEKPYTYAEHIFPHDIDVHDYGSGNTRRSIAESLGINPITVAPKLSLQEGINAVRALLPRAYFDQTKCEQGINCLRNYRHKRDEEKKVFLDKPEHTWASHGADAMRTGAVGFSYSGHERPLKIITNQDDGYYQEADEVRVMPFTGE